MEAIIAGIVSGIISSIIIYVALFCIKPHITISKNLCRDPRDDLFKVKIVNHTRANLVDVRYTLHHCHRYQDGIVNMDPIPFSKSPIEFVAAYSHDDNNAEYAIRFVFPYDEKRLVGNDDYILFTFYARHSVTGSLAFFSKEYRLADILCGKFETGTSTKALVEQCSNSLATCDKHCTI